MLYSLVRPVASVALKAYFGKIFFSHRDRIPLDKPVLLATNHPTAFLEPCIFACFQPRNLHFLARGDFFQNPFYSWLLRNLHLIPIYRRRDGFRHLKNNQETFEKCYNSLAENAMIMILAEGRTILGKRLRPVQRGAAKIAFGAIEAHGMLDIHIVPAGATFMDPNRPRTTAMVSVGTPIRVLDYWEEYQLNPQETIKKVTDQLYDGIRNELVHVDDLRDDKLVDQLLEYVENDHPMEDKYGLRESSSLLEKSKEIANYVNGLSQSEKKDLQLEVDRYHTTLLEHNVSDFGISHIEHHKRLNDIIGMILYLPWLFIRGVNYPPIALGNFITDTFVTSKEFYGPIKLGASMGAYFIWYLILSLFAFYLFGIWGSMIVLVLLPVSGWLAILFHEWYKRNEQIRKASELPDAIRSECVDQRKELASNFP